MSKGLVNVAPEAGAAGVTMFIAKNYIGVKAPTPQSKAALTTLSVDTIASTYALAKATYNVLNSSNTSPSPNTLSSTSNTATQTAKFT